MTDMLTMAKLPGEKQNLLPNQFFNQYLQNDY